MSENRATERARSLIIRKLRSGWAITPNMPNHEAAHAGFRRDNARQELNGLPGTGKRGLNIALASSIEGLSAHST